MHRHDGVPYAANLADRVLASRLARAWAAESVLLGALGSVLAGLPFVLSATSIAVAALGQVAGPLLVAALAQVSGSETRTGPVPWAEDGTGRRTIRAA
jgi:hypothetical protein